MSFHLRDMLHVLFKRKKTIIFVWLFCVTTAVAYSIFAKPVYEATASVLIKVGRENVYVPSPRSAGEPTTPIVDTDNESQMNSEVEILKSRLLVEKVLDTLGATTIYAPKTSVISKLLAMIQLRKDVRYSLAAEEHSRALRHLQADLKMEGIKKSNVIKISFRHVDPEICAKVLNTLLNLYLEQHLKIHQVSQSYGFFDEQSSKLKNDLGRTEFALNEFEKKYQIVSPEEQKKLLLKKGIELSDELAKTERMESEAQTRVDYYKSRSAPNAAYVKVLEVRLQSESALKEARAKKPLLMKQIADNQHELDLLSMLENDFFNLHQEVELSRQNLRLHQTSLQEAHHKAALDKDKTSNVSIIDPAWPPLVPVTPKGLFIVLSFLLGSIAGIAIALYLEFIDDHIKTDSDIERYLTGLPLLGSIPYRKA